MDTFWSNLNDVQRRRLFNSIVAVFVLLAVFLALQALTSLKRYPSVGRGEYLENTITVSGTGEVFVVPDTGSLSFSVVEEAKTVKDAQSKATTKMNAIIDALKAMDIDEKDIKTIGYYSNPKYEYQKTSVCPPVPLQGDAIGTPSSSYYCPEGRQIITGYVVSQTVSVKIRKTDTAGDVLTKVGSLGASNISGLDFVTDDIEKVKDEARDKAIADAREKAKTLAKSLDVKLIKIVSFNESGDPYYYYGRGSAMDAVKLESAPAMPAPQLPVGENKITVNVSVTYEIR